jgi:putative transposase
MRALVAARDWLTVFQLPPYASELNPVESVWSHLKRSLANLIKRDIAQLKALAKTRLRRMQYRHSLIEGFLAGTRLDLTPSVTLAIEDRVRCAQVSCDWSAWVTGKHGHDPRVPAILSGGRGVLGPASVDLAPSA